MNAVLVQACVHGRSVRPHVRIRSIVYDRINFDARRRPQFLVHLGTTHVEALGVSWVFSMILRQNCTHRDPYTG
jgi:hypothetical protein